MTTLHEIATEALRVRANVPFPGPNQRRNADAVLSALWDDAEQRVDAALKKGGFDLLPSRIVKVILTGVLGSNESEAV